MGTLMYLIYLLEIMIIKNNKVYLYIIFNN